MILCWEITKEKNIAKPIGIDLDTTMEMLVGSPPPFAFRFAFLRYIDSDECFN